MFRRVLFTVLLPFTLGVGLTAPAAPRDASPPLSLASVAWAQTSEVRSCEVKRQNIGSCLHLGCSVTCEEPLSAGCVMGICMYPNGNPYNFVTALDSCYCYRK